MTNTRGKELSDNTYSIVAIILWLVYVFVFRSKFTIFGSLAFTYILLALWLALNTQIAIEVKKWKYDDDAFAELVVACSLPVVTFTFIAVEGHNTIMVGIAVACVVLSIMYFIASVKYNLKDNHRGVDYRKRVKAVSFYRARSFLVVCISLCMVVPMLSRPIIKSANKETVAWSNERTVTANYDKLKVLLDEEEFATKDIHEREELFKMIVDAECNYLGIPYVIKIKTHKLNQSIVANFNQEEGSITVDTDYLSTCTGEDLIDTGSHEVRHAYQYEIVKLYDKLKKRHDDESMILLADIIGDAPVYSKEFTSYKDSGEKYYRQQCEEDAREYAEESYKEWKIILSGSKGGGSDE